MMFFYCLKTTKDAVNTLDKLTNPLNCFTACHEIFNKVDSLECNPIIFEWF